MDQAVKTTRTIITTPFTGVFSEDIEVAKLLIAAYPNVNLVQLRRIAADPQQPESARVASIYILGHTDDHGTSKTILTGLAHDPNVTPAIRDHAIEALESLAPHH